MKRKITFWKLLGNWFWIALVLLVINGFFIKISIIHNLILASLGMILLIYPVWPEELERKYSEKKCKLFMRAIAVCAILFAFSIRIAY